MTSQINPEMNSVLRNYLAQYVTSWYDPANYPAEHRDLSTGRLRLISTCYRAKVWAGAALPCSSIQKGTEGILNATLSKGSGDDKADDKADDKDDDKDRYTWDAPLFRTTRGSSKLDVKKITYTVAVEVYELEIPTTGLRLSLSKTRSSIRSKLSIPFI